VQTTLIPAGGAVIVEFRVEQPGCFLLVDHAISRATEKGALGALQASGEGQPGVFKALTPEVANRARGH
jgi:nitrite reductase (NO-forming)